MINDLLQKYTQTLISYEVVGRDPSSATKIILEEIAEELRLNNWSCSPSEISNYTHAMIAFYDMTIRKIGGDVPGMLCYYFCTIVSKDTSLPTNARLTGNMYRAFIIFKTLGKWDNIISLSRMSPIGNYRGHLTGESFFDLLLLCDVYKAWDVDPTNPTLTNLKRQAPNVAANHPAYSRTKVIEEGELAHEALFNVIKSVLKVR